MRQLTNAIKELVGLLVEDGFVAVGALLAIAAAYGLTRPSALGPTPVVGGVLFLLLVGALAASLSRAATNVRKNQASNQ
jgi:hypothetical protein